MKTNSFNYNVLSKLKTRNAKNAYRHREKKIPSQKDGKVLKKVSIDDVIAPEKLLGDSLFYFFTSHSGL
jgi:Trk K+ transport system NAD-binding subunit